MGLDPKFKERKVGTSPQVVVTSELLTWVVGNLSAFCFKTGNSLFFLGLDTNAIVNEDGTGSWSRAGKKLLLTWRRAHSFLACSILNQIEKRTGLGPHPGKRKTKQAAVPRDQQKKTLCALRSAFGGIGDLEPTIADSKSGQV